MKYNINNIHNLNANRNEFWLENPAGLFKNFKIIPMGYMSLEEQMNCITRLVFFTFLILYLFGYKQSLLFLLLSFIFIIILYYLQKSKMNTYEFFNDDNISNMSPRDIIKKGRGIQEKNQKIDVRQQQFRSYMNYKNKTDKMYDEAQVEYKQKRYTVEKFPTYYVQQLDKEEEIHPDQSFVSINQNLVGKPNPKTLKAPITTAPMYDWQEWRESDLTVPNMMNEKNVQDFYRSGYYTDVKDNRNCSAFRELQPKMMNSMNNKTTPIESIENYEDLREDYDEKKKDDKNKKKQSLFGKVDEENLKYNLPYNYNSGSYQKTKKVSELNKRVFTSIVSPDVYYENEVIEPISSTIGISYTQQLPTTVVKKDRYGNVIYDAKDPQFYKIDKEENPLNEYVSNFDVYDPRSNGYGTSYRGYVDKLTGKSRYYYDDVDSVRRPNFVTRNNIDHLSYGPKYGTIMNDIDTVDSNNNSRANAETSFNDDTIGFRTEMMERLMRKRNSEMWQNRVAPKSGRQFSTITLK
jgi:hypothetical protein